VITGRIRNDSERPKPGWYLEVDVLDPAQKVLATVRMVNGVQLFTPKDYGILEKRGTDIHALKAQIILSVQTGEVPSKGSVAFEAHLMDPPDGAASFLPVLKTFDPGAMFEEIAGQMDTTNRQ
jgi:hypothetical protein